MGVRVDKSWSHDQSGRVDSVFVGNLIVSRVADKDDPVKSYRYISDPGCGSAAIVHHAIFDQIICRDAVRLFGGRLAGDQRQRRK
jgi:hypothetical protein